MSVSEAKVEFIPFFHYCDEGAGSGHDFDHLICPSCGEHVEYQNGPFAEDDPTKPLADVNHWLANHQCSVCLRSDGMSDHFHDCPLAKDES